MEYRLLTIEDYNAICDIWNNTEGMGLRNLDDSRRGIEKFLLRNPSSSFIALDGGKAVGGILCGHDGRRGFIYHTCVLSEYRERGVGSRLTELACEALKREGIHKCALLCYKNNEAGNRFWTGKGWERRTDLNYYDFVLNPNNESRKENNS